VNRLLRKWLTGIGTRQEYLCLALEDLADTFTVHLTRSGAPTRACVRSTSCV